MANNEEHNKLVRSLLERANSSGCFFLWKNNSGRMGGVSYGYKGSPDLIGLDKTGRFFGIEVKTGTGRLSVDQIAFKSSISRFKGIYVEARDELALDPFIAELSIS